MTPLLTSCLRIPTNKSNTDLLPLIESIPLNNLLQNYFGTDNHIIGLFTEVGGVYFVSIRNVMCGLAQFEIQKER